MISLPNPHRPLSSKTMVTIRNYDDNGPYFSPTQDIYQAANLQDVIFHVRQCMEDNDYQIGLFDADGQCKGMWLDEAEPEPDGEGGMMLGKPCYALYRPGQMSAGMWNLHLSKFKRA
jgi:hypothetical protein